MTTHPFIAGCQGFLRAHDNYLSAVDATNRDDTADRLNVESDALEELLRTAADHIDAVRILVREALR